MIRKNRASLIVALAPALLAAFFAPQMVHAEDTCCFNNFRFAGGCQVRPASGETCASVLSYLNSFDSVGSYYCGNTTVRGGWTLTSCTHSGITAGGATVQESQPTYRTVQPNTSPPVVEPKTAPGAADASLIQTAAPMKVRFDDSVDSGADGAGHIVFGHLEEDLMSGDTVIAPAGSEVQAELVPTSFWTDGGGDAFEIQATSVKVGDQLVPLSGIAIQAEGQIPTSGEQLQVPEGSLVSFETGVAKEHQADKAILETATARWMEAFNTGNAEALAALYAEDAVVAPPNAPAIFGRDAIRADHQEQFASADLAIELEDLEFVIQGDLGYKAGRYRMRAEDDTLVDRGKYLEVWRKIDGTWLIHRDIYNSSLPLPAGDEKED
jgi:uncharacterized protein (TIGR02246 family)